MPLTRVKSSGVTSGSFLASGSVIPVSSGGTGRTAELHSSWVLDPQISSPGSCTQDLTWSKDPSSVTDNLNGTDVTMSSGVITFPSTGLYRLEIEFQGRHPSSNVSYVGFTWEHSSNSGGNYSTVWRRLGSVMSGNYFYDFSKFHYNVTNASTQRIKAKLYATALSGLVIDGGDSYTSTRLYITKMS